MNDYSYDELYTEVERLEELEESGLLSEEEQATLEELRSDLYYIESRADMISDSSKE